MIGIFFAAQPLGTSLGPLLGGTLAQAFSWRAPLWMLATLLGIDFALFTFFFRDTFRCDRSLTYRRALAHRGSTVAAGPGPFSRWRSNVESGARVPAALRLAVLDTTIKPKEGTGLGDGLALPSSRGTTAGDGVQEKITPSLADVNPFPPVLSVLQRRNNIPTLISSGTTYSPLSILRFPRRSLRLVLQVYSLLLAFLSRTHVPERSTRRTTTTRSKSGSSSSPLAPGVCLVACSGDAGLTGSCVG